MAVAPKSFTGRDLREHLRDYGMPQLLNRSRRGQVTSMWQLSVTVSL